MTNNLHDNPLDPEQKSTATNGESQHLNQQKESEEIANNGKDDKELWGSFAVAFLAGILYAWWSD
jgi:hypothetical protein